MASVNATNGHTNGMDSAGLAEALLEPKKLVLCFDGTGNTFSGSNADTNVVKLLNKLDRHAPHQFHYYQTGIGTYDINEKSVNKTWFGEMRSSIAMTIDQGIGNTFDAHVMAGYRFLMKFYDTVSNYYAQITTKNYLVADFYNSKGAKIYLFGFSAKFLARMVNTVGLLCKGNEEMIPFAYRLYQRYLAGEIEDFTAQQAACDDDDCASADGENPMLEDNEEGDHSPHGHNFELAHNEILAFSNTFCRKEIVAYMSGSQEVTEERNIKVYFLGLWDCVNSVAPLERHTPVPVPVKGTARFVRHAVSVDERRVKFKPALLSQDVRATADNDSEDLKEVWFPGCHGDVGGGWPAVAENPLDTNAASSKWTVWQRVRNLFTTRKPTEASKDVRADPFQMSDIPLAWMIRELELVGEYDKAAAIQFSKTLGGFKRAFQKRKKQALNGAIHDSLKFGHGTGFFKVLLWKFMEVLPTITRWELEKNAWVHVRFPLNAGASRDIPRDAVLHESLIWRLKNNAAYSPSNNHGGSENGCLKHKGTVASLAEVNESSTSNQGAFGIASQIAPDPDHQTKGFQGFTSLVWVKGYSSQGIVTTIGTTTQKGAAATPGIGYCGGLDDPTIATNGDEVDGPGFWITKKDDSPEVNYFLYENSRDEHPWKYLSLPTGATAFVSVCGTWQGRVVRGIPKINLDGKVHNLGTWFKSSVAPNGWMWGDISFLEGCDGGGSIATTDGSNVSRECYEDLLAGAPSSALATKETGTKVLAKLVGDTPNQVAKDWELSKCSTGEIWIDGGNSGPVIKSTNGRLEFVFYKGKA
ncbi:hypothetical protein E0Z10_g6591 [Xylaria hypoxylon]|uniref:T6SS Phospholipase effector Tle1-like catalytic domain-containing protein n=1 Tax=Xylaria hypoxylon TaxID=37992 RepID=A0A4Z0YDV4_9PEZI|nr:hypothetical protein E0Z10_g6591 [Xylaria hypoxylon]